MTTEEDPLARSLRRSWTLPVHALSLIAGAAAFASAIGFGRPWLVSVAGACFVVAGVAAIAGGHSILKVRGWSAGRHFLSEQNQIRGERMQGVGMGGVLVVVGIAGVVFGLYATVATR